MPDTPVSALDARQQKLVGNARRAYEQGNLDYVVTVCTGVLAESPGCAVARRLRHAARSRQAARGGVWRQKMLGGLAAVPLGFGRGHGTALERLAQAEKILDKDPTQAGALRMLAAVAEELDWPETAVFAREVIRERDPRNPDNLLALGEAWLRAGRADDALRMADEVLRQHPVDGAAQTLLRKASIAQATRQGQWEQTGDFHEKLKVQSGETVQLQPMPAPELKAGQAMPPAELLVEARTRVEKFPGDLEARFQLAELLLAAGDIEPAIAQYQQAQRNPKLRWRAVLGLARGFRARGLVDLAVTQLSAAKGALGPLDELKEEVVYELGECYEQLGRREEALAEFKEIYAADIGYRDVAARINAHGTKSAQGV